tara:strand:+ start:90 stop:281 length:192 start_codon:yes stop_codon:yes gene_type:complete
LAKNSRLNIHSPETDLAIIVLALTQIPVALINAAEVFCIGQTLLIFGNQRGLGRSKYACSSKM